MFAYTSTMQQFLEVIGISRRNRITAITVGFAKGARPRVPFELLKTCSNLQDLRIKFDGFPLFPGLDPQLGLQALARCPALRTIRGLKYFGIDQPLALLYTDTSHALDTLQMTQERHRNQLYRDEVLERVQVLVLEIRAVVTLPRVAEVLIGIALT